jgi:hypothetical protein
MQTLTHLRSLSFGSAPTVCFSKHRITNGDRKCVSSLPRPVHQVLCDPAPSQRTVHRQDLDSHRLVDVGEVRKDFRLHRHVVQQFQNLGEFLVVAVHLLDLVDVASLEDPVEAHPNYFAVGDGFQVDAVVEFFQRVVLELGAGGPAVEQADAVVDGFIPDEECAEELEQFFSVAVFDQLD